MSKILDNTTGAPIFITDTGITVDNVIDYTIPPQDYLIWAASDDIITEIGSGNIVVNDGSTDLSINDGAKLIQGIFPNPLGLMGDTDQTPIGNIGDKLKVTMHGAPASFSSKYRSVFDEPVGGLVLTASYQTIYTYSGSGLFIGFVSTFSNSNVKLKFTIDSDIVFEMESSQVNDAQFSNPTVAGPNSQTTTGGPTWDQTGRRFGFMPGIVIGYGTDIKIEALQVGVPAVNYIRTIANLTKET